jgi:hypothetical protein
LRATRAGVSAAQPIRIGLPFPAGFVGGAAPLALLDGVGRALPAQWQTLSSWPDRSVRWALLDFWWPGGTGGEDGLRVSVSEAERRAPVPAVAVSRNGAGVEAATGVVRFSISASDGSIVARPESSETPVQFDVSLSSDDAAAPLPRIDALEIETAGPLRATIAARGVFPAPRRSRALGVRIRVSCFAGSGLLHIALTVHNPTAARHRGGRWDLGDPGAVCYRDLSVRAGLPGLVRAGVLAGVEAGDELRPFGEGPVEIYQESSGGVHWSCPNHVNRQGEVPLRFRGYRVRAPGPPRFGLRASPVVCVETPGLRLSGTVEQFWQNFPKAAEATPGGLCLRVFPGQFEDGFELQPGEQKTHHLWFQIEPTPATERPLAWVHDPVLFAPDAEWCLSSRAVTCLGAAGPDGDRVKPLLEEALSGGRSFFAKREVADEYGWRHFGDVYADHEETYYAGPRPLASHYNNQYDLLYGLLARFLLTGDARLYELGRDLARHVVDIDIYRTRDDKPGYCGGLFWHTDHYDAAYRSGHRTYSSDSPRARGSGAYGGGPSNEHNYASGLLLYHHLSGDRDAREAVLSLAEWVVAMDDGALTLLAPIDSSPTGLASRTYSADYHGPGRGAGNSISVLLDAYEAGGERRYLAKAEELIRRCIHPRDDLERRKLRNLESRWSYLVFLQSLGKYLEVKLALGELDRDHAYARQSLLHYARYVRDHEVPYRTALDRVEFPTETWTAHDLRKSVVLGFAARHAAAAERQTFRDAAERFHREALEGLASFETRTCSRPLAIVLQNEPARAWLMRAPTLDPPPEFEFGSPADFVPQRARVAAMLRSPKGIARVLARLLRPDRALALLRLALAEVRRR